MKTLVVTGGTGLLGRAVVPHLERSYRCVLLKRPAVDLFDEASVRAALQEIDEPYGLVHLAGGWDGGTVSNTTTGAWNHMLALNLTSAFVVIRETLARMKRDEPGRIIAISSLSSLTKDAKSAAYTVSKAGLNTLIELTAKELAATKITANALLPGALAELPLDNVADAILYLLSDAAQNVTGALIPLKG